MPFERLLAQSVIASGETYVCQVGKRVQAASNDRPHDRVMEHLS